MTEHRELYAYTVDAYYERKWVKVGDSQVGRHEERIAEQFGTSNPEKPKYILIGPLPDGIRDHSIHAQMTKNGCQRVKDSPGREWFHATFDDVRRAYNQVVNGSSRLNNHQLRAEQRAAVAKAKSWLTREYPEEIYHSATHPERFLLNAKMRFGKCFTGISLAKEISARNTLIVTYKPDVIGEWIDTVNDQVCFDGWTGIRAKRKSERPNDPCLSADGAYPATNGPVVLCVSLQDLAIDLDGGTKERLKTIPQIKWDLVIFDEVHYGSRTERVAHILKNLDFDKRLDLSGTPFRIVEHDDFCAQQVFTYSYLDEQVNKRAEQKGDPDIVRPFVYRQMPDLNISTIEVTEQDIAQQLEVFITDDVDFSLNELFKTKDGEFVHEQAVDHFLDGLTKNGPEARAISVFGALGAELGTPPLRHVVFWLNRVDSVGALVDKMSAHPYFSRFTLLNAAGTDANEELDFRAVARDKSKIESTIRDAIQDPTRLGTITLTCGRFLTGVTIKEWDSILILNDVKSAESYFQAIFRVQSAWYEAETRIVLKPKAWVFDFAISRCLRIVYECASNIADQIDQQESYEQKADHRKDNLEIVVSGLCADFEIKRFIEGSLKYLPTTSKEIFEILNHEGSRLSIARRITSNVLVNFGALRLLETFPQILDILRKIKGYRTQEVGTIEVKDLVQIGADADALEKLNADPDTPKEAKEEAAKEFVENDDDKERKTRKNWYATQIKRLAICMADFIYMTYEREYSIDDVIHTKSPEFFEVMTGISKDDFTELCEKGFVNRFALNRIVREFRDQETISLNPEEYIVDVLRKNAS